MVLSVLMANAPRWITFPRTFTLLHIQSLFSSSKWFHSSSSFTMINFASSKHFYSVSVFVLLSSFTPDEWEAYTSENIAKAERERKASVALRSEINGILMQTYVDLRNIFETVNNEFTKRIEESLSAKRSLEKELARVNCGIFILSGSYSHKPMSNYT